MKKRFLALLLSTMMITSSTLTAFAADSADFSAEEEFLEVIEEEDFEQDNIPEETDLLSEEEIPVDEEILSEEEIPVDDAEDAAPAEEMPLGQLTTNATGYVPAPNVAIVHKADDSDASLQETYPAKYINTNVPALRNQGSYGTCWAHAAIGVLEINLRKTGIIADPDLSELHLASFFRHTVVDPLGGLEGDYFDTTNIHNALQLGGNSIIGFDILANWTGAASEELLPYSYAPLLQSFGIDDSLAYDDIVHIKNFYFVPTNHTKFLETKDYELLNPIKKAITDHGAVTIAYRARDAYAAVVDGSVYNPSTGGYYCTEGGKPTHEVVCIGWDDNYSKENFAITAPGDGAFLIRNSWADDGDVDHPDYSGYYWMSYYEATLEENVYTADAVLADDYDNNYQYDAFFDDDPGAVNKGANVFTAHAKGAKDGEELKAVSVFMAGENLEYTVDIYTGLEDPMNPESGTKAASATAKTSFAGRYTVPLEKSVTLAAGETFSVVVTCADKADEAIAYDPSTDGELANADRSYTWRFSAKEGQSFSYTEGEWKSMTDNLKIKAFTDNILKGDTTPVSIEFTNVPEKGLDLGVEQSYKLQYSISPIAARNAEITWKSDNPEVAACEYGYVTGVSEGTTTITATTENGVKASFEVTVTRKLKSVTMSVGAPYYNKGLYQRQCTLNIEPEGYEPKDITWYSDDESVLTVDQSGVLTFRNLGIASVIANVEGVIASLSFYGRYRDDEAFIDVRNDNSILITWTPKERMDGITIARNDENIFTFLKKEGEELPTEYLDTYFKENPVTEETEVTYDFGFVVGEETIPMTMTTVIKPVGIVEEPVEDQVADWGDVSDEAVQLQFENEPSNIPTSLWYVIDGTVYKKSADLEGVSVIYDGMPNYLGDKLTVYCGNHLLSEKRDYEVTYKNNTTPAASEAAKPTMIVTGKGSFSGSASFTFTIAKAAMDTAELVGEMTVCVDKSKKTKLSSIKPVITFDDKKLKEGKDFTYLYAHYDESTGETVPVEPSTVVLTTAMDIYHIYAVAQADGYFEGEKHLTIVAVYDPATMVPADKLKVGDAKGKTIEVAYEELPEEGLAAFIFDNTEGKTPKGRITYKGKELVYGKDYDVYITGMDPTFAGIHTASLVGKGDTYIGTKTFTYKVKGFDIKKAKFEGLSTSVPYLGNAIEVENLFKNDEITLYKKTKSGKVKLVPADEDGKGDFMVTSLPMKDAGKYTIYFVGINGCIGIAAKTITVTPYDIKKDPYGVVNVHALPTKYSKAGAIPEVTVTFGNVELTEGIDYTLSYKNNKKVAARTGKNAPTVTIKGIGNFKGTAKGDNFAIFKKDVSDLMLVAADVHYNEKGKDGYFLAVPKIMDGTAAVSVGKNKDIETVKKTDYKYYYATEATMTDGSKKPAGDPVLSTDKPAAGTEILVVLEPKVRAKSPYSATPEATIAGSYRIVDAAKDITKGNVTLAESKKLSVYYNNVTAADLVVTLKGSTTPLVPEQDYTIISATTNKSKKTVTVTIRGIGGYGGMKTVTFKMVEGL